MHYVVAARGRYYFNRRVPEEARHYDPRKFVRISLKTDSKAHALRKAVIYNEQIEAYWQELISRKEPHDRIRFKKAVRIARLMGFSYQPLSVLSALPIVELVERVLALKGATATQVEAVLGGKDEPSVTLTAATDLYWTLATDKTIGKTERQLKKWKTIRLRAIRNFITLVGDKEVKSLTRDDVLRLRDWWVGRIKNEGLNADSANKDFINLRSILDAVSGHLSLGLDIQHLFHKILLKVRFRQTRLPFSTEQILAILKNDKIRRMNEESRWFLCAAAETGARPAELAGLMPDDIRLQDPVPHICITDRAERPLKNAHTERKIPLVGYALEAFKAMPGGFPHYRDKADNLTIAINSFLRENGLLPSKRHTCYSFRHSFQDRILSVNAPDRIQAELMGHKFLRPKYGDGGTLELKKEWMDKICIGKK